jgi:DNA polymerase III subunit delta'
MTTSSLFGHTDALKRLLAMKNQARLPHALLIAGPKGIGKATFAKAFAAQLLGANAAASARMDAGSHADFMVIQPEYDEKNEEFKREIGVDEARKIPEFLSKTPAEAPYRVVIVDAVDELNTNAANAILKILEEPPAQAVLLLVSHNPASLLPTIRSRCQVVALSPLGYEDFRELMLDLAPEISPDDVQRLGELTHFSPGLALKYHEFQALKRYDQLQEIINSAPNFSGAKVHALADSITQKQRHSQFGVVKAMLLAAIAERAKRDGAWAGLWFAAEEHFSLAENAHLDYKSSLLGWFEQMRTAKAA